MGTSLLYRLFLCLSPFMKKAGPMFGNGQWKWAAMVGEHGSHALRLSARHVTPHLDSRDSTRTHGTISSPKLRASSISDCRPILQTVRAYFRPFGSSARHHCHQADFCLLYATPSLFRRQKKRTLKSKSRHETTKDKICPCVFLEMKNCLLCYTFLFSDTPSHPIPSRITQHITVSSHTLHSSPSVILPSPDISHYHIPFGHPSNPHRPLILQYWRSSLSAEEPAGMLLLLANCSLETWMIR
ncbi:uncharacterized protein BDV17DRAFT_11869 [Aspergillus undulatus]|uniref:uncharacterized protein n=1 Tax=Aspergillus undulatus TaxID=1810928 RepID=UPI003CCC92AA